MTGLTTTNPFWQDLAASLKMSTASLTHGPVDRPTAGTKKKKNEKEKKKKKWRREGEREREREREREGEE